MLYFKLLSMEINLNCDLGEKSKHHSNENDPDLLKIVNSANVACGYHAGDEETMREVVEISKQNNVSIGAHPSFNDPENFGRKRINLGADEISKLLIDQYEILQNIAIKLDEKVSHIKPHGALNNMACGPARPMTRRRRRPMRQSLSRAREWSTSTWRGGRGARSWTPLKRGCSL